FDDFGATLPTFLNASSIARLYPSSSCASLTWTPVTSPRRRWIADVAPGDNARAPAAISSDPKRNARSDSNSTVLNLDLDDFANPDVADALHHDRAHQHHLAHALAEEQLHVLRVDEIQGGRERGRQRHQDIAGESAVRRVGADIPLNLEALADDVGEPVENLREVAAGVALDQDGGDEEPDVEQVEARRELVERIAQRQAEVL